ncbi:MAG TPA: hypothetical protein VGN82_14270 [Bosea sp. (in: a-proteobacteria)]|jgi:hypothetical protein|uniref:hypothetical protein n=1 Tax=Bosea sp. (in: a-proteobacteria) TaxID=1871050 RepID=UPI002E1632FA|nr:hypothetical protein [Bosea sp. (in: a-proteobacteria)]
MKITNISKGPRGVNATDGTVLIEPGESVEVELSAAEAKIAKATGWFDMSGKAKAEPKVEPDDALEAKHAGGGVWYVMKGDERVSDGMKKDDAEAFNALSADEKAVFIAKPVEQAGA